MRYEYLECSTTTGAGTTSKGVFVVLAEGAPTPVNAAWNVGVEVIPAAFKVDEPFVTDFRPWPAGVGASGAEGMELLAHGVLLQARFELEHFDDLENGVGPEGSFFAVHAENIRKTMGVIRALLFLTLPHGFAAFVTAGKRQYYIPYSIRMSQVGPSRGLATTKHASCVTKGARVVKC